MQVTALGYLGLTAAEPEAWASFGPDVLGTPLGEPGSDGSVRLRLDERAYRLAIHPGATNGLAYVGWEVPSPAALDEAARELAAAGCAPQRGSTAECAARGVQGLVRCADPAGNALELFYGPERAAAPFAPTRPISGFVAGDLGLGHVVLGVADLDACRDFYTGVLGFRVSDVFDHPRLRMAFLRCNARHHSLALGTQRVGLHHLMLEVRDPDDVGVTYDLCQARGVPLAKTLGRHSNDLVFSFYLEGPSGIDVEYGAGSRLVDDATWTVARLDRASIWGHQFVGDRAAAFQRATSAAS